jgi:cholesterol transport system auxiliary component
MANNILIDRRLILLSASSFLLAGCGGLGLGPTDADQTIYVLQPALTPPPAGGSPTSWALAIDVPNASDSIDSRRIALIKSDSTMDYYANASWPDRLPVLVQTALLAAFQASGRVPSVSRTQDALHADYELGVEIRDCAAHYSAGDEKGKPSGNPNVTVTLIAQMSTAHGRLIVANFTATQKADASQNSTAAVVQALNTVLGAAVQQIVAWALTLPAPAASKP